MINVKAQRQKRGGGGQPAAQDIVNATGALTVLKIWVPSYQYIIYFVGAVDGSAYRSIPGVGHKCGSPALDPRTYPSREHFVFFVDAVDGGAHHSVPGIWVG